MLYALYTLGWGLAGTALAMVVPATFGILSGERQVAMAFMNSAVALLFVAGGLILALRRDNMAFNRHQQLLSVLLIWSLLPLGAAAPLYFSGIMDSWDAAYFEATSAFTTSGATIFVNKLSSLPRSIILWRAILQWSGGLLTLLMVSYVIGRLMGVELFGRDVRFIINANSSKIHNFDNVFLVIAPLYAGLTIACLILLYIASIPFFDALCLSLSTISTGGMTPGDGTISKYSSPAAELALTLFMFFGGVSLVWVRALFKMNLDTLSRTREPLWIALAILLFALTMLPGILAHSGGGGTYNYFRAMSTALASATSIITTTGFKFENADFLKLSYLLILPLALIGGGRYSTAGGLRFNRVLLMFELAFRELRHLLYPHGVQPTIYQNEERDRHVRRTVWSIVAVTTAFIIAIMLSLSMLGVDFLASLMLAVSMLSNFGTAYGMTATGSADAAHIFSSLNATGHLVLCSAMIIGRMEAMILLGIINMLLWRS